MTQKLYWTQYKNPPKICQNPDCSASVSGAVPISPHRLREYLWLCRPCARVHNANWNYKDGKTDADMERIIRDDMCWNRPTQPFERLNHYDGAADIERALQGVFGGASPLHHLPKTVQSAYTVLELSQPLDMDSLKTHYKRLVKKYHPDTTGNAPTTNAPTDDKMKNINVAYDTIREYMNSQNHPYIW